MGIRKLARRGVFGLDIELGKKFDLVNIKTTMADVIASSNTSTVASTGALNEMLTSVNQDFTNVNNAINGLIDDSAAAGADVTWSVDQIMGYIASVDDSVVVGDLLERDALAAHNSLVAFVLDTTGDTALGENEGQSAAYIFAEGVWKLATLLRTDVDHTVFVKTSDIVNDSVTGGIAVPASAESVKVLAAELANVGTASNKIVVTESLVITSDTIVLASEAEGDVIGGSVEVLGASGYMLVDATLAEDKKTITLGVDTPSEFDGVNARVSYLTVAV